MIEKRSVCPSSYIEVARTRKRSSTILHFVFGYKIRYSGTSHAFSVFIISRISDPSGNSFKSSRIYDGLLTLSEEFSLIFKKAKSIYGGDNSIKGTIYVSIITIIKFVLFIAEFDEFLISQYRKYIIRWQEFAWLFCFFYTIIIKNYSSISIVLISKGFYKIINSFNDQYSFSIFCFFHML